MVTDQLLACDAKVQTVEIMQSETLRSVERPPIEDRLYEVTKAPYVAQLKAITNKYLEKPTSLYDRARYLLFGRCLHHVILPICFVSYTENIITMIIARINVVTIPFSDSLRNISCSSLVYFAFITLPGLYAIRAIDLFLCDRNKFCIDTIDLIDLSGILVFQ